MTIHMVRRRRRIGVALLAFMSVLAFFAPAALAQEEGPPPAPARILQVDHDDDSLDVLMRAPGRIDSVGVEANGQAYTPTIAQLNFLSEPIDTAIILDNSEQAENDETFQAIKDAAVAYVNSRDLNERISIITAGGSAKVRRGFTNSIDAATSSVLSMVPSGDLALWDAIDLAALNLSGSDARVRNIVVITAHADARSSQTAAGARGSVVTANASLWVAGVRAEVLNDADLARGVELAGGDIDVLDSVDGLSDVVVAVGDQIKNTYLVRVDAAVPINEGANRLSLNIDGVTMSVGFSPDTVTVGGALVPATRPTSEGGLGFLKTDSGKMLSVLLGAVAAGLAALAFALLFEKDTSGLNAVLQPYAGDPGSEERSSGLSKNALFARAFEITEQFAERRGVLSRTEAALERADLPLRAAEALTFFAGGVLIVTVLVYLRFQNILVTMVFVGLTIMAGPAFVNFAANRRKKKFMSQLPDTLQLLSGTLKAGYSFMQGLEAVSQESEDPMGEELRRVVTEAQLGRPVEDALDTAAERMDSPDFAWAVMAVKIQREVGGNLSELLMTVSETMVARERLRRDVAALTAEGRISAIVLGALPVLLGLAMWAINPEYVGLLFSERIGNVMLIVSVIAALAGFAWMKKIINIEI